MPKPFRYCGYVGVLADQDTGSGMSQPVKGNFWQFIRFGSLGVIVLYDVPEFSCYSVQIHAPPFCLGEHIIGTLPGGTK